MAAEQHRPRFPTRGFGKSKRYDSQCTCGWVARGDFPTEGAAQREFDDHVEAVPHDD